MRPSTSHTLVTANLRTITAPRDQHHLYTDQIDILFTKRSEGFGYPCAPFKIAGAVMPLGLYHEVVDKQRLR